MSKSHRLGPPRCFAVYDPETGRIIAGLRVPAYRLHQQMTAYPGMKIIRVASLRSIRRCRVVNGKITAPE